MQELIAAVAAATGWPASMVERSALARAKAEGVSVEAVLSAWAGGGAVDAGAAATAAPVPASIDEAAPAPAPAAAEVAAPAAAAAADTPQVEVVDTPTAAPQPEPEPEPEVRRPAVPKWLAASFVFIPAIAVMYALFFPNGVECGVGAQLGIDPVTGEAENCDGSPYGSNQVDFFATGEELFARNCAACHGANGEGGGNFPALSGGAVVATFPACDDHLQWVGLGSLGWPDATYGANATPVGSSGAQMPAFGGTLDPEELGAVVLYERVAFGDVSVADAEADCLPDPVAAPAG
jgi:hypothetical protein